jgi:hypothetical protein
MEERKEFKRPEVISYDREELAFETALTGGDSSGDKGTDPAGG